MTLSMISINLGKISQFQVKLIVCYLSDIANMKLKFGRDKAVNST